MMLDLLLQSPDLAGFLGRLAGLAAADLTGAGPDPGVGSCIVAAKRNVRPMTAASSDPAVEPMEALGCPGGGDPLQMCTAAGGSACPPDQRSARRSPGHPAAGSVPMLPALAVRIPLPDSAQAGAVLVCYSSDAEGPAPGLRARAEELASLASRPLQAAIRLENMKGRSVDLAAALESRTTISLAAGVVMAQSNCTPEEAVGFLKSASMNRNQKMHDIAAGILSRYGDPYPQTSFD
jgi:hypothetical protein